MGMILITSVALLVYFQSQRPLEKSWPCRTQHPCLCLQGKKTNLPAGPVRLLAAPKSDTNRKLGRLLLSSASSVKKPLGHSGRILYRYVHLVPSSSQKCFLNFPLKLKIWLWWLWLCKLWISLTLRMLTRGKFYNRFLIIFFCFPLEILSQLNCNDQYYEFSLTSR